MILNTLEVIFSIIFHVLITQSAAINVRYVLFVVLQLLVLLTLGCCEIWVHHIPLLECKEDNLPILVKYNKLALLYIWNVKEKNAWCEDFLWELDQNGKSLERLLPMVNWQLIDHDTNLFLLNLCRSATARLRTTTTGLPSSRIWTSPPAGLRASSTRVGTTTWTTTVSWRTTPHPRLPSTSTARIWGTTPSTTRLCSLCRAATWIWCCPADWWDASSKARFWATTR